MQLRGKYSRWLMGSYANNGTGGNFNVARPPRIEGAGLIDNTSGQAIENPMEYTRDSSRWAEVTLKTLASTLANADLRR
jgi:hypothetical protein